nr:ribonuclease H-like domain-containing protein [Tanacetum cinerariifolium]
AFRSFGTVLLETYETRAHLKEERKKNDNLNFVTDIYDAVIRIAQKGLLRIQSGGFMDEGLRARPRRACRGQPTKNDTTNVNDGGSNRVSKGGSDGMTTLTALYGVEYCAFGLNLNGGGVGDVLTEFTDGRSNFTPSMFGINKFSSSVTEVTAPNSSFTGNVEGTLISSIFEVTGDVFSSVAEQTSPTPEFVNAIPNQATTGSLQPTSPNAIGFNLNAGDCDDVLHRLNKDERKAAMHAIFALFEKFLAARSGAVGATSSKSKKVKADFHSLVYENVCDGVDLTIPRKVLETISTYFENTLYGYFIDIPLQVFSKDGISVIATQIEPLKRLSYLVNNGPNNILGAWRGEAPESRGSGGSAPGSRVQGAAAPGRVQGAEPGVELPVLESSGCTQGNPLYLHANDSSCASICFMKLIGVDNYRIWASAMKLALQIKHKMGFITGTCVRTDYLASAPLLEQWDRCNAVVLNWILSSLSHEVYLGHVFSSNVATGWNELKDTYDRIDGSIVFNLLQKTNSFKQRGLPVFEYYHKLNSLWREYEILTKLPNCTCSARLEVANYDKMLKLMQGIPSSSGTIKTEKAQAFAFMSKQSDMNRSRNNNWSNNRNNVNRCVYDSLLCKNCGLKGHTIDRYFKLIGYPPGFKRNPNLKPNTNGNSKSNSGDFRKGSSNNSETKTYGNVSFTNEQVMKLMSLLNDKGSFAGQSNMAGANLHMTNSIKDMVNLIDVSDLKLTIGHPNRTLAKITHGRVLGTSSEFGGLYLFDKEYNNSTVANNSKFVSCFVSKEVWHCRLGHPANQVLKVLKGSLNLSNIDHEGPCEVCHKAKQTKDSFPLSENKSTVFGQLMHLDVWGSYKVISREGFRYFLTIVDDYSRDVKFYETIFPYKMSVQLDVEQDETESEVTNLNFFDCVEFDPKPKASISPNDDEEGSSCRDGSVHQSGPSHSLDQPEVNEHIPTSGSRSDLQGSRNDGLITTNPIDENTSSEGNVGFNDQVPVFQNVFQNQTYEVNLRKSSWTSKLPAKFNEYVLDNKVKYGLNRYANHTHLDSQSRFFISNLNKMLEPSLFEEASKDPNWISAMNDEMNAVYENDTWNLVDLTFSRKPIGSKWVFKIKYKSDGKVDRFKARVVAKGFRHKEGLDYEETFTPVVKMRTEVYMLPPPGFFDPSDKRVCIEVLKVSGGLCLSQRKYCLELLHDFGLLACRHVLTPLPENIILAYKETEKDKFLVKITSYQSKKQVTLSKSSAEAEYRSMAAATCEIMWIVKIMSDLNIKNLLPGELYYDNKAAMQIAANPVMYEKTKHFDLDVYFIREKVCSGLIKTVKVKSKDNAADILTKALGSFQHGFLKKKFVSPSDRSHIEVSYRMSDLESWGSDCSFSNDSSPALVFDDSCNFDRDLSMSLMGKVKDINTLPNLYLTIEEECFQNVKLSHLGGLWVLNDLGYASDIKNKENANDDDKEIERISETNFDYEQVHVHKHSEGEVQSEDSFNMNKHSQDENKENVGQSLEEDPQYPSGFTPVENNVEKGVAQCMDNFYELVSSNSRNKYDSGSSKGAMPQRSANMFSKVHTRGSFLKSSLDAKLSIQKKILDVDKVLDQGGYSEDTMNYRSSLLKEL